jgi:hypothetical protein
MPSLRLPLCPVLELQGSCFVSGIGLSAVRTADVYLITCDEVLQEFGYLTHGEDIRV